jgi:hypothetical protein
MASKHATILMREAPRGHFLPLPRPRIPWQVRPFLQPPASSLRPSSPPGIVLMEVVLALALLVLASGVILGSMNTCTQCALKLKLRSHAADLAVTLASEIQMGVIKPNDTDSGSFAGLPDWTWQMHVQSLDLSDNPLERVEISVRHKPSGVYQGLVQLVPAQPLQVMRQDHSAPAGGGGAT